MNHLLYFMALIFQSYHSTYFYDYFIQVPVEHHINPVTKTDWEGVGVVPHIKTKKEEALNIAYIEALNSLIADTKDKELGMHYDKLKKRYKAIKEKLIND